MGIAIGYKGSLNDSSRLSEAMAEIDAFCKRNGWRCENWSEHYSGVLLLRPEVADGDVAPEPNPEPWPDAPAEPTSSIRARVSRLRPPPLIEETCHGILAHPPGTEALMLAFNPSGRLCRYMELPEEIVINAIPDTVHYVAFPNWVKTTGAIESHVGICALFKMLRKKFIRNLKITDDTGFWKSWNYERLCEEHEIMGSFGRLMRQPETLNVILRAAGLPELDKKAKVTALHKVPLVSRKKQAKPRSRIC